MKISKREIPKMFVLLALAFSILSHSVYADSPGKANTVLKAMEEELARSMKVLGEKGKPPPYYIGYRVSDNYRLNMNASYGALVYCNEIRSRLLDVDVRVGSYKLDNTHAVRGSRAGYRFNYSRPRKISLEDDAAAIKSALWLETDKKYKAAAERMIQVEANKGVTVEEEDQSDDFSREPAQRWQGEFESVSPDAAAWKERLKKFSLIFIGYPGIHRATVSFGAQAENKYFANSEGTSLQHGRTYWRLSLYASTTAEDGMRLYKTKTFSAHAMENLPDDQTVEKAVHRLAEDLLALKEAPLMEPFTGPAILSGRAAGVFFHEIFGHRIEGHRQKDERDGQTFTKKINERVLPTFVSVYDDPTLKQYKKMDLIGHYLYDDEGVKAQRVTVVDRGILKNFVMSRSPVEGFSRSNGHGRGQPGRRPVARQGNLVIESAKTVPNEELRRMLLAECKAQGKPYGLLFDDIAGGFTFTGRYRPQAFNVTPITVYRIYVDGRPDELVRGVNLIGTPLTSFSKIMACGQKPEVFNGYCGAESGSMPVAAVCPPILTAQIEVQKKPKGADKPPVLPPPQRREK